MIIKILILMLFQTGFARTSQDILKDMTLTYSNVEFMKTNYEKSEISELLGDETKTKGRIEYSKGRIRIEEDAKTQNIFIKNKKNFWHLQDNHQVLTGSTKSSMPTIFELMFEDPKVWDELSSSITGMNGDEVDLKIFVNGKIPNVNILYATVNTTKRRFEKLSFTDDIGNKTEVVFKKTSFFRKAPDERFTYTIKPKDKVTRM